MTPQHSAGAGPLTAHGWNVEQILVYVWQLLSGEQTEQEYPYERFAASDAGQRLRIELDALNARLAAAPTGQADASDEQSEAQADLLAYLMSTPPPSWQYDEVLKMVKAATNQEAEHALQSMDASLRKLEKAVGVAPVPQDLARLEALRDKWREIARRPRMKLSDSRKDAVVEATYAGQIAAWMMCADELDAELTRLREQQGITTTKQEKETK